MFPIVIVDVYAIPYCPVPRYLEINDLLHMVLCIAMILWVSVN